jgi:hypothetical protein
MKRIFLVPSLMLTLLSACMARPTNNVPAPIESQVPAATASTEAVVPPTEARPNPKLPAAPFESQPYFDETVGFAFD